VRLAGLDRAEREAHVGKRDAGLRELRALFQRVILAVAGFREPDALPEIGAAVERAVERVGIRVHARVDLKDHVGARLHDAQLRSSGWRWQ
jgi:hypothetical protein